MLILDRNNEETIRHILTPKIEQEDDYYLKKLMEIALEGIIYIYRCDNRLDIVQNLAAMVDIKNNPLEIIVAFDNLNKFTTGIN